MSNNILSLKEKRELFRLKTYCYLGQNNKVYQKSIKKFHPQNIDIKSLTASEVKETDFRILASLFSYDDLCTIFTTEELMHILETDPLFQDTNRNVHYINLTPIYFDWVKPTDVFERMKVHKKLKIKSSNPATTANVIKKSKYKRFFDIAQKISEEI